MDSSGITRDDWMAAMREVNEKPLPDANDGAVTTLEFAVLVDVSRSQAYKRLIDLVNAGKAQRCFKLQRRNNGGVVKVPAFKLLKPTKEKGTHAAHRPTPKVTR